MMDEFMEGGMDFNPMEREFDRQFAQMEQEFYRDFLHTMRKTIELCHNMECCQPPESLHDSLCRAIECTPQIKPRKRKSNPKKKL